jgi:hypothetical protein
VARLLEPCEIGLGYRADDLHRPMTPPSGLLAVAYIFRGMRPAR